MSGSMIVTLSVAVASCVACGAAQTVTEAENLAYERFADLAASLPPEIRTRDISVYSTNALTFALNNGLAMTPKGRLWASWISGGDSCQPFTAASYSDDGGDTWSDTALVIDGHGKTPRADNICGRTNIIGTFRLDSDGRFRLYTDQTLFHFDGRAGIWSYPDACQGPDGTIYVTHDVDRGGKAEIRFHRFTEADVLAGRIVSPRGKLGILVMRAMSSRANRNAARVASTSQTISKGGR